MQRGNGEVQNRQKRFLTVVAVVLKTVCGTAVKGKKSRRNGKSKLIFCKK